jgi:hypothetical protein
MISLVSDYRNAIDMMRELVLKELVGGLWHTTHPDRFTKILETGGISPEPDIPEKERWGTRDGRESSSYVRFIGGVSLFDLYEFEPESYTDIFPSSSWHYFIPFHMMWGCAVWIEINRDQVGSHLISPTELKNRWESEKAYRNRTMPGIEAAYMGVLPRTAFKRAFMVRKEDAKLHPLEI